jgi:pimeloyl-ACP methyl ester carboxylesterase
MEVEKPNPAHWSEARSSSRPPERLCQMPSNSIAANLANAEAVSLPKVAPANGPATVSTTATDLAATPTLQKTDVSSIPSDDRWTYGIDVWQRSVLFWDVLRQRANIMMEHDEAGMPPVLTFEYEMLLDARRFERPANYALLRITTVGEDHAEHCVDHTKPPVVVIDPRAGHGPGIGGFKRDSEVGTALHEGFPVYFTTFFPTPSPHQRLVDVLHALRRFVDEVIARHPGKTPVLYGNCQGGWAAMLVAIHCEGPVGAVVLNGSPLSYWAGASGTNPMRLAGGLLGGGWMTNFLADLGNGQFDGAWLVENFETLKPENAIWEKYANLFLNVDQEQDRFLEFERWWNAWYSFSREEIVEIVDHLFIGNELEQGTLNLGDDVKIDLRKLRSPLVVFASYGDNITPPHQALAWLSAVYKTTDALKEAGQRIVYLINPHVGHLGIFVSASVARFEHRAILESLRDVEALAPGLYKMKISNPTGDPDCCKPYYSVAFEERRVEDLIFDYPRKEFERVRQVSDINEALYRTFVSPWVQAAATPWSAAIMKWLHPMRTSRYLMSERFSPWMYPVAAMAELVRKNRVTVPEDSSLRAAEKTLSGEVTKAIGTMREARDKMEEVGFRRLYG